MMVQYQWGRKDGSSYRGVKKPHTIISELKAQINPEMLTRLFQVFLAAGHYQADTVALELRNGVDQFLPAIRRVVEELRDFHEKKIKLKNSFELISGKSVETGKYFLGINVSFLKAYAAESAYLDVSLQKENVD